MKGMVRSMFAVLLVSCSTETKDLKRTEVERESKDVQDPETLEHLIERLPSVRLPWTFELWGERVPSVELSPAELELLTNDPKQEAGVGVGLIVDRLNTRHILWLSPADSELPMITTFSPKGEFVRYEGLVIGQCGPGPCYECKETVRINEDFTVMTTDTVTACECDSTFEPTSTPCAHFVTVLKGLITTRGVMLSPQQTIDLSH